jgi:hypothetical protein
VLSAGATRTLNVTGRTVYIQVIAGTTTDAEVIADIAASQAATGLLSATGTTGTFEAGYAGGAVYLWYSRTVATAVPLEMNASGVLVERFATEPTVGRVPAPATVAYGDGLCYTATPLKDSVVFVTTPGGALGVAVTERTVTVTVQLGVDTVATVTAAIAASAAAAELVYFTGQAGIFPIGFAGASSNLWEAGIIPAATATAIGADGYAWPLETNAAHALKESPYLPDAAGSTPSVQQGVIGRLTRDYIFEIAAGDFITIHPKQSGVSVIVATAAAAAVSATGKVVTLTNKNDDTTDVTAMLALIAASASVNALLSISGTGADTFDHLLTLAGTTLWYSGTIPANCIYALGADGYNWPCQLDANGRLSTDTILDTQIAGEDLVNDVLCVEGRFGYATNTAEAQVKAGAGHLHTFRCNCTTAGTLTIYNNTVEGAPAMDTIPMAIGDYFTHTYDVDFTTGCFVGFDGTWAGSWSCSFR